MYPSIGINTQMSEAMSDSKPRFKVLAFVGDREISKYTDSHYKAVEILERLKEAAKTLSLLDIFRGEIHEIN